MQLMQREQLLCQSYNEQLLSLVSCDFYCDSLQERKNFAVNTKYMHEDM